MKGLPISIFTHPTYRGCAAGGLSELFDEAIVVGPGIPEIFAAGPERPVLKLESHVPGCVRLLPIEKPDGKAGPMFGGSFGSTSDSRFTEAIEALTGATFYGAVAIHDRFE